MTGLLSIPAAPRQALRAPPAVSPAIRLRAGKELQRAVAAGTVTAGQVETACRAGTSAIARLMLDNHALTTSILIDKEEARTDWKPDEHYTDTALAWARSLITAGRLSDLEVGRLRRGNPLIELTGLCARASFAGKLPELPPNPAPRIYPVLWVGHSYIESLTPSVGHQYDRTNPFIRIEVIDGPIYFLPQDLSPDDRNALLSVIDALFRADPFRLLVPPMHLPWVVDGWMTERLQDIAIQSRKDESGRPIVTHDMLAELEEEFGLGFEDLDAAAKMVGDHAAYLAHLADFKAWPLRGKAMKRWRAQARGTALAAVVDRLVAITDFIRRLTKGLPAFQLDCEGDPVGVMLAEPPKQELPYLDYGLDQYGQSEIPCVTIIPDEGSRNPTSFWSLYDAVVMVANLVTDAAHAIESLRTIQTESTVRRAS